MSERVNLMTSLYDVVNATDFLNELAKSKDPNLFFRTSSIQEAQFPEQIDDGLLNEVVVSIRDFTVCDLKESIRSLIEEIIQHEEREDLLMKKVDACMEDNNTLYEERANLLQELSVASTQLRLKEAQEEGLAVQKRQIEENLKTRANMCDELRDTKSALTDLQRQHDDVMQQLCEQEKLQNERIQLKHDLGIRTRELEFMRVRLNEEIGNIYFSREGTYVPPRRYSHQHTAAEDRKKNIKGKRLARKRDRRPIVLQRIVSKEIMELPDTASMEIVETLKGEVELLNKKLETALKSFTLSEREINILGFEHAMAFSTLVELSTVNESLKQERNLAVSCNEKLQSELMTNKATSKETADANARLQSQLATVIRESRNAGNKSITSAILMTSATVQIEIQETGAKVIDELEKKCLNLQGRTSLAEKRANDFYKNLQRLKAESRADQQYLTDERNKKSQLEGQLVRLKKEMARKELERKALSVEDQVKAYKQSFIEDYKGRQDKLFKFNNRDRDYFADKKRARLPTAPYRGSMSPIDDLGLYDGNECISVRIPMKTTCVKFKNGSLEFTHPEETVLVELPRIRFQ